MTIKAFSLFSGGLDSLLAARVVMEQGVEVTALHFITPFFGYKSKGNEAQAAEDFREKYGISVRIIDVSPEYIEMVRKPVYGYGKNFNPCLDCKIFMMKKARGLMLEEGADFIISGEVLGQRPMSQRRDAMSIVERDSGLKGYLLRPLCAKLLPPTIPEQKGLVDREKLYGLSGRSRKGQMELADKFGIKDYATPAGGCMLTDPILSKRIQDFIYKKDDVVDARDLQILTVGRFFKFPTGTLHVGRNEKDNERLLALSDGREVIIKARDIPGPISLCMGIFTESDLELAARITARYSDNKGLDFVAIDLCSGSKTRTIEVRPAPVSLVEELKVG
ncbi:MAG: 7-cyano-7-deazaguanine synthase [Nitrospirota bacterium]